MSPNHSGGSSLKSIGPRLARVCDCASSEFHYPQRRQIEEFSREVWGTDVLQWGSGAKPWKGICEMKSPKSWSKMLQIWQSWLCFNFSNGVHIICRHESGGGTKLGVCPRPQRKTATSKPRLVVFCLDFSFPFSVLCRGCAMWFHFWLRHSILRRVILLADVIDGLCCGLSMAQAA